MSLSILFHSYRDKPIGRWGETGVPWENHLTHPQAELGLSHMWPVQGSCETSQVLLAAALRPSQQFFSHVRMFSWVEPVLSNEDEVSCSRTQHHVPGEIRTHYLGIKESGTLPTELTVLLYVGWCGISLEHLSLVVRKPAFCICENKDADPRS